MIDCRDRHATLRRGDPRSLDDETRRHLEGCGECGDVWKAALLLALGSASPDEAALRPGFAERVRAALPERPPDEAAAGWSDAIGRLLGPAMAAASGMAILTMALALGSGLASGPGELDSFLESDPVFGSVLAAHGGILFAEPDEPPTGWEAR